MTLIHGTSLSIWFWHNGPPFVQAFGFATIQSVVKVKENDYSALFLHQKCTAYVNVPIASYLQIGLWEDEDAPYTHYSAGTPNHMTRCPCSTAPCGLCGIRSVSWSWQLDAEKATKPGSVYLLRYTSFFEYILCFSLTPGGICIGKVSEGDEIEWP